MWPRCSSTVPPLLVVITGRDPVIHDFFGLDAGGGKGADAHGTGPWAEDPRIKSCHDDLLDGHGNSPALAAVGFGTAAGSFGLASDTTVPGVSRYWPRTTTISPALKPLSISASPLSVSRTETGCIATL